MLIGVLSDSHGHADTTARAVAALADEGAQMLLHLGDIGTEEVIDELAGRSARIVFGNCDWEVAALSHYAELVGVQVDHPMGTLEVDGRRIAFTHGHIVTLMSQALDAGVDYLFHGHTHEIRDDRVGDTRMINPGALHQATRYTAALFDPSRDSVRWIEIAKPSPSGSHG